MSLDADAEDTVGRSYCLRTSYIKHHRHREYIYLRNVLSCGHTLDPCHESFWDLVVDVTMCHLSGIYRYV